MQQHQIRPGGRPASSVLQVSGLIHPAFRIEIEALAAIPA
jgi:enamine deaminase RidA (YjgF/YER057c/UK114 family)